MLYFHIFILSEIPKIGLAVIAAWHVVVVSILCCFFEWQHFHLEEIFWIFKSRFENPVSFKSFTLRVHH